MWRLQISLLGTKEELSLAGRISWSIWLIGDWLTAFVEFVDAGDVVGAHEPASKDLVWVRLSDESRLAVLGEGVPWGKLMWLVFSFVFTCDGRVKRMWSTLTCCNAWRRSSRREYPSCLSAPWQSFRLFLGRSKKSSNAISLQREHLFYSIKWKRSHLKCAGASSVIPNLFLFCHQLY